MKNSVFVIVFLSSIVYALDGNLVKLLGVSDGIIAAGLRALGACLCLLFARSGTPVPKMNAIFWGAVGCSSLGSILFVLSIVRIPVGISLVLFHSAILWIVLYKWLLMRPITMLDAYTGVFVFFGIAILCVQKIAFDAPLGWIFGILSGASFGAFLFLGEEHIKVNKDEKVFKDAFLVGQVVLVLVAWLRMETFSDGIEPSSFQVMGYLFLGAFYGGGYILLSKAMALASGGGEDGPDEAKPKISKGGSQLVSLYIGALEPPLGLLFGSCLLGERITQQSVCGFVMILTSISVRGYVLYKRERRQS